MQWMSKSVLAMVLALVLASCSEQSTGSAEPGQIDYPYHITCTIGMVTDVVRNVAGDRAEVEGIIGEGVDPHLYKPTRGDVVKLDSADVIFYNGLMLEGKMGDVLLKVARKGKPVYAVTETIIEKGD